LPLGSAKSQRYLLGARHRRGGTIGFVVVSRAQHAGGNFEPRMCTSIPHMR
jgi:hypothetical protein